MHDLDSSTATVSLADETTHAPAEPVVGAEPVEYFNAPYHHRPSAAPGLVLGVLGLGLIFLGGCFMIGLLILTQSTDTNWSSTRAYIYMGMLYLLAGLCFAGAGLMLFLAVKSLLKAARG